MAVRRWASLMRNLTVNAGSSSLKLRVLNGADAVVAKGVPYATFLGVVMDPVRNVTPHSDGEIGMPGGAVRVLVVAAREDLQIAYEVRHSRRHAKPIRRATGGSRLLTSQDERQCRRINQHSPARSLALVRGARRHQFSHRLAACPPKPRSRFAARCSLDEVGKGNVGAIYSRDDTITGCFKTPVAVPPLPDQRTTPAGTPAKTGEQRRPPPSRPRRRGSSPPPWPHSLAPA